VEGVSVHVAAGEKAHWTDDRTWIAAIRHAPDASAKLGVLAEWAAAAGGGIVDGVARLPPLRHHRERRLAEVELRRVAWQLGLEVVEDAPP
jgi:hypothetical protein